MTYELSASIDISATPDEVYAVISDVSRTGEWSVQCQSIEWITDERGVGAQFVGHNRTDEREWDTTSEVVAADPGREFAWEVLPARVRWGYQLEPIEDGGTRLTHFTHFTETAEKSFAERFGDDAENQIEKRHAAAESGIPVTLEKIKTLVDGE